MLPLDEGTAGDGLSKTPILKHIKSCRAVLSPRMPVDSVFPSMCSNFANLDHCEFPAVMNPGDL